MALGTLLAGCFASDKPMFSPASAIPALGDGGRYATFEVDEGKEKPSDPIVVRPGPANVYDFTNEKGHATPVTFHPIASGLHVAQVRLEGSQGYGYVVARVAENEVVIMPAECARQDKAKMDARGVVQVNHTNAGSIAWPTRQPSSPGSASVRRSQGWCGNRVGNRRTSLKSCKRGTVV